MTQLQMSEPEVYQGHFGEFTITEGDRQGVLIYRTGLMVAALCFALGSCLVLWQGNNPVVINSLTFLYAGFCLALGVSLLTIHIYMELLHRLLQALWVFGTVASVVFGLYYPAPLALTVYHQPLAFFSVGFVFAALTGIYFKEGFCFNRLETKLLTPLLPILLLGHLLGFLSVWSEQLLLGIWAVLFVVFALRKLFQAIPQDIGDKSVFTYLKQQHSANH